MSPMPRPLALLAALVPAFAGGHDQDPAPLAGQLGQGMELVYTSDGVPQPPWTVDSVRLGVDGLPGAECVLVQIRRNPGGAAPERFCLAHDTLYRRSKPEDRWEITRPVGPRMQWSTRRANGDSVHYETGATSVETIGGLEIGVVHTQITTVDSLGRAKARLRERYALGLLTATGGTFERPDSTAPGGWQPRSTFELKEIRPGPR
jgi:hypothetical protein